jgi:hypothetical protein
VHQKHAPSARWVALTDTIDIRKPVGDDEPTEREKQQVEDFARRKDSSLRTTALYLHVTARRLAEVRSPLDLIGSGGIGQ